MGQQQLLLLVLGITVVGLAVVIALQVYANNEKKNNADMLASTSMRVAVDAQAWLSVPTILGGGTPLSGDRPADFTGQSLTLDLLGYPVNGSGEYKDVHGTYTTSISGGTLVINAASITTSGGGDNNIVCTIVSGVSAEDIVTVVNPSSGSCPTSTVTT